MHIFKPLEVDFNHLDPRCLSSAKLTFIVHIEVHLPNSEDEDDDEATVQKNLKKTPKASKEAKGNHTTYKNDHLWEVSITVKKDMNISQFQSLIFSGCDKHYQDISEGLKKALFQGFQNKDDFEIMTPTTYDCFIHNCFINSQQMIYLNIIQQNPKSKLKKESIAHRVAKNLAQLKHSWSQGNFQKESTVVNSYEDTADGESCMCLVNPQNRDQLLKLNTAMLKVWAQDII
ncbi:hypothetical protein CROQUDRAFT_652059, partial [Cronartium quercuum f. sp. fusiforme G11]